MVADFVEFLIQNGSLEEKYREDSIYGLTLAIEKAVAYVVLLGIAFFLGKPVEGLVFLISFLLLRQTTGGFHAKTFFGCLFGSGVTFFLVLEILAPLTERYLLPAGILFLFSIICIFCFSPVNHPNLMLTGEEKRRHRYLSRGVLALETGVAGIFTILHTGWKQYVIMAVIVCAVFILIAKLIRQEVIEDEVNEKGKSDA